MAHSPSRKARTVTWRHELKRKPWTSAPYWLDPLVCLAYLSYTTLAHLLKEHCPQWAGLSLHQLSNPENALQTRPQANLTEAIPRLGFLPFSQVALLCVQLTKTNQYRPKVGMCFCWRQSQVRPGQRGRLCPVPGSWWKNEGSCFRNKPHLPTRFPSRRHLLSPLPDWQLPALQLQSPF